jgi:hypothetical protein
MRACQVAVTDGMKVEPQAGHGSWELPP